jgi:Arc/MetJ-type ribon-helix-helix transcriptional regulator
MLSSRSSAMPTTEQLVIDLPPEIADIVRSRMASGRYANASAVVEQALIDTILPPMDAIETDEWIRTEGVRRYDAMRADPSRALSIEEAFSGLDTEE